jgi:tRNA pseudouridine55 synthase
MRNTGQPRREAVDGLLLLNKPAGLSSNQALQRVKRLLNAKKAGHTGSLDPAATGMLPLCFGEATKVCPFLLNADKTYRVTAKLGVSTDSGDADGIETETMAVPDLTAEEWQALMDGFLGDSEQIPPMYSALKHDGKRLYELARKGVTVDRKPRPIRIDAIELLEIAGSRLVFRVACSKGTYIRVLVEDLARAAGTIAHTARLHREIVGDFQAEDMHDLSTLEAAAEAGSTELRRHLLSPDIALTGYPSVTLSVAEGARFCAGMPVTAGIGDKGSLTGLVRVYSDEPQFLGLGEASAGGQIAPKRVFLLGEKNP